jgi:hypothetical protein
VTLLTQFNIMATQKEKLAVYEKVLHQLQLYAEVTMNGEKVNELIGLICSWSYAHRCGNGELSDKEQQRIIDKALQRLKDFH